jgi:hypothetical protein
LASDGSEKAGVGRVTGSGSGDPRRMNSHSGSNVTATNGEILVGINVNFGDTATLSNVDEGAASSSSAPLW